MKKFSLLLSALLLFHCTHRDVAYVSVTDPRHAALVPFEFLLPRGTQSHQNGPYNIYPIIEFILLNDDKETGRMVQKFSFDLEIRKDLDHPFPLEKFCVGQPNRDGRGVFEVKKVKKFENGYSVSAVEVPCLRYEIYLITNGDDSFIVTVFSDNSEWARDAIEYGVEHIRFLPENETVKQEEEKRKEHEWN